MSTVGILALVSLLIYAGVRGFPKSNTKSEKLTDVSNAVVDKNHHVAIDTDDTEFSPHGNMSLSWDADTFQQRKPTDLDIKTGSTIDNSDIIDDAIRRSDTNHQPLVELGVTTTENAYLNPYKMAEKDERYSELPSGIPEYAIPLNDRNISLDEALAVKQNHRSMINRKALEGAVRSGVGNFERFFRNELDENEKRVWYSAESTDSEVDFRPYE